MESGDTFGSKYFVTLAQSLLLHVVGVVVVVGLDDLAGITLDVLRSDAGLALTVAAAAAAAHHLLVLSPVGPEMTFNITTTLLLFRPTMNISIVFSTEVFLFSQCF